MLLAPSILAADLADLAGALEICDRGQADLLHVDVMDGHFVPNLSIGLPVVQALAKKTDIPLDVHLMVTNPDRLLDEYIEAGAAMISVHWEVAGHLDRLMRQIRDAGVRAGIALNPATPVEHLVDILAEIDFVLLMSVNPGFAGQSFLPYTVEKARRLRTMIEKERLAVKIAMDGGIGSSNIRQVGEAGVEICVAGSAVFKAEDPAQAITDLKQMAETTSV